jgi:mannose-1-phosphate guanylyltransferase/mannose-6-phosphate isomerase
LKVLILAGGCGTRLWPLSRKSYPKQFLKLNGDESLLQQTVKRFLGVLSPDDMVVITNNDYKFHVKSDLNSYGIKNIILEPYSKNTAPAIALGVRYCRDKLGCSEEEIIFVSPSDHIIRPEDSLAGYLQKATNIASEGYIVTFGVKPDRPETGYGYIKINNSDKLSKEKKFFKVDSFTEKPDLETAQSYLNDDHYYWNSGMFAFAIRTITDEFKAHSPQIGDMLEVEFDEMVLNFDRMPSISIDYAVMEKSKCVALLPIDFYWNDIGSWDSIYNILDKDEMGNVKKGNIITADTQNTLIIGNKRLISTIGLDNYLIIETDDAVLVAKKGETQKVKDIVNGLKKDGRKEIEENVTTYRPWGNYTVLEEGPRYKIKRIVVNPEEKLSLQMHYHRSEHWVVVRGAAKVKIGDKEIFIHENESAYVPKSTLHRLENPGKVPLEIIEVQNGEYVGEDDIVRVEDVYGRQG